MRYSLASMVGMATTFFRYFLFHAMASSFLSSSEGEMRQFDMFYEMMYMFYVLCDIFFKLFRGRNASMRKRLTMYNKAIIGFGFCDMQNYQSLGKSYLTRLRLG